MSRFEDRLWAELVEHHGALLSEPPTPAAAPAPVSPARARLWLRPASLTALGLALLAGLVALVINLGSGGGPPAYGVFVNSDGSVTVSISELTGIEPAKHRLEALGLPVRIAPVQAGCSTPPSALRRDPVAPELMHEIFQAATEPGVLGVKVQPRAVPPGDTLLLTARERGNGVVALTGRLLKGKVAPACVAPAPGE
jgi:hypothetical protein